MADPDAVQADRGRDIKCVTELIMAWLRNEIANSHACMTCMMRSWLVVHMMIPTCDHDEIAIQRSQLSC